MKSKSMWCIEYEHFRCLYDDRGCGCICHKEKEYPLKADEDAYTYDWAHNNLEENYVE